MTTQIDTPLYQTLLEEFEGRFTVNRQTEPDFLHLARQEAMACFRQAGFPSTKVEDWKYTNLAPFLRESFRAGSPPPAAAFAPAWQAAAAIPGLDCYQILLGNGQYLPDPDLPLPSTVRIRPLSEAWQEPACRQFFSGQLNPARHALAALNTALFGDGLFIEVAAHASLDKPLHLVHAYDANVNQLIQPRHLVVVGPDASLPLIESVFTDNGPARLLVNSVSELVLAPNARLQHYHLQQAPGRLLHLQHTEVSQQRDSVYNNYTFSLPAADLLRNTLNVALLAQNTESHLYGFYLGANHQLLDNHTLIDHRVPYCESNEVYKGVLLDTATGVFNGKVWVQPGAQKTNAFQQNNNLLLSPKAVIYSKPQLEIYADDVKCSHGSTTGQLNPEALFYLRSRGIGEENARSMLVAAFAFDVTEQIRIPKLKGYVNQLITQHLPVSRQEVAV